MTRGRGGWAALLALLATGTVGLAPVLALGNGTTSHHTTGSSSTTGSSASFNLGISGNVYSAPPPGGPGPSPGVWSCPPKTQVWEGATPVRGKGSWWLTSDPKTGAGMEMPYPMHATPAYFYYSVWSVTEKTAIHGGHQVVTKAGTPGHWVRTAVPVGRGRVIFRVWVPGTPGGSKWVGGTRSCVITSAYYLRITAVPVPVPCTGKACVAKLPTGWEGALKAVVDWHPATPTSNPPAKSTIVFNPTWFHSTLKYSWPKGTPAKPLPFGGLTLARHTYPVGIGHGRYLEITVTPRITPVSQEWRVQHWGAASGKYPGLTRFYASDPAVDGYQSAATQSGGQVFRHDATNLTVTTRIEISVSATATWSVAGTDYSYQWPTQSAWTPWSAALAGEIQQIEGI